jgi:hypothetical protein
MTKAEVSFVNACDDMGADVAVTRSTVTVLKDGNTNTQSRKVLQGLTAEVAPQVAKAIVDNLSG